MGINFSCSTSQAPIAWLPRHHAPHPLKVSLLSLPCLVGIQEHPPESVASGHPDGTATGTKLVASFCSHWFIAFEFSTHQVPSDNIGDAISIRLSARERLHSTKDSSKFILRSIKLLTI